MGHRGPGGEPLHRPLNGVLRVAPVPARVPVVEHAAEMGDVSAQLFQVGFGQLGGLGLKGRKVLLWHLLGRLHDHPVMGQADVGLGGVQLPEFLLCLPQGQGAVQQVLHVLLNVLADEAVLLPAVYSGDNFFQRGFALGKDLLLHLLQQAFQNQRHREAAAPGENLVEMLGAKAQTVGLNAHVGLHHGRAGDVGGHAVLQHVAHTAKGTALFGLENLVDGYRANVFSHSKNLRGIV